MTRSKMLTESYAVTVGENEVSVCGHLACLTVHAADEAMVASGELSYCDRNCMIAEYDERHAANAGE